MYKINIHAHTIFSDGMNTPYVMAKTAKELGFSSLIITDHLYLNNEGLYSLDKEKYRLLKKACEEAKDILPVIIGVELAFGGEEILVFGSAVIKKLIECKDKNEKLTLDMLLQWKKENDCAFILCHPRSSDNWKFIKSLLDGFEEYNGGQNKFKDRSYGVLEKLPRWCNSDAHNSISLEKAYNIINSKIVTEQDIIKYIKRKNQPKFFISKEEK